ncbi:MAG: hypothetical protein EXQ70_03225 [Solirubrobacterales bacterium]|nr:hypothetical protein [Solirubrobacterales bacterium]
MPTAGSSIPVLPDAAQRLARLVGAVALVVVATLVWLNEIADDSHPEWWLNAGGILLVIAAGWLARTPWILLAALLPIPLGIPFGFAATDFEESVPVWLAGAYTVPEWAICLGIGLVAAEGSWKAGAIGVGLLAAIGALTGAALLIFDDQPGPQIGATDVKRVVVAHESLSALDARDLHCAPTDRTDVGLWRCAVDRPAGRSSPAFTLRVRADGSYSGPAMKGCCIRVRE